MKIFDYGAQAIAQSGILQNPYLERLSAGSMTLQEFRKSQEQFYFAVLYFSQPMAALAARVPDPYLRVKILENLLEEHGEFNAQAFHCNTFKSFLESVGTSVNGVKALPPVHAFNSALSSACALEHYCVGLACMGVIEQSFATISAIIGNAVVKNGWIRAESLVHYQLHAKIDQRHAEDFYSIIETTLESARAARRDTQEIEEALERGMSLGLYIFERLYRDLIFESKVDGILARSKADTVGVGYA
jgi:pyrroloquinoline-quinone synthase